MNQDISPRKLGHFTGVIIMTIFWILVMYVLLERIIAKLICFVVNKKIRNLGVSMSFLSMNFRFNFGSGFSIRINEIDICIENLCHIQIKNASISQNRLANKHEKFKQSSYLESRDFIVKSKRFFVTSNRIKIIAFNSESFDYKLSELNFIRRSDNKLVKSILNDSIFRLKEVSCELYLNKFTSLKFSITIKCLVFALSMFNYFKDHGKLVLSLNNVKNKQRTNLNSKKIYRKNTDNLEASNKLINTSIRSAIFISKDFSVFLCNDEAIKNQPLASASFFKVQLNQKPNAANYSNKTMICQEVEFLEKIELNFDPWSDLFLEIMHKNSEFLKFRNMSVSTTIKANLKNGIELNLNKKNDTLFSLNAFSYSKNEFSIQFSEMPSDPPKQSVDLSFNFNQVIIFSCLEKMIDFRNLMLEIQINESTFNFKLQDQEKYQANNFIYMNDLLANLNLAYCVFSQFAVSLESLKIKDRDISVLLRIRSCFLRYPFEKKTEEEIKVISLYSDNFSFKLTKDSCEKSCFNTLIVLRSIRLFTNLNIFSEEPNSSSIQVFCEKAVLESIFADNDIKIQIFTSPLFFGTTNSSPLHYLNNIRLEAETRNLSLKRSKSNLSVGSFQSFLYTHVVDENSKHELINQEPTGERENFFAHNCFYLTVFQMRYQCIKSENVNNSTEIYAYAHQFEFICGDFFGTMNIDSLFNLTNLVYSLHLFVIKEAQVKDSLINVYFKDSLSYRSTRLLTSLVNLNVLDNDNLSMDPNSCF
jgi:hypothetical protein